MLHNLHRSSFVRPRERLYELITLYQADLPEGLTLSCGPEAMLDARTLGGYVEDLESRGLLARKTEDSMRFTLTSAGRHRLRLLIVDLAGELDELRNTARTLLCRSLIPLAIAGLRRVAFYPFGETAEAAYAALDGLGFELVGIFDDAVSKEGLRFHGLRVQKPERLRLVAPEAVIVTSAVFQDRIVARLEAMQLDGILIHLL